MTLLESALLFALLLTPTAGIPDSDQEEQFCGDHNSWTSENSRYSVSSNVWNPADKGEQCIQVNSNKIGFSATWNWPTDKRSVHSYPHIKFHSALLPCELGQIESLKISANWSITGGDHPRWDSSVNETALEESSTVVNVAIDMFADRDANKALDAQQAGYEIMIWLASYGDPYPLGWNASAWDFELAGHKFTLYRGSNQRRNLACTFISHSNLTGFEGDITPFLRFVIDKGIVPRDIKLGLVEFGQEAYRSYGNVTFSVSDFRADISTITKNSETAVDNDDHSSASSLKTRLGLVSVSVFAGVMLIYWMAMFIG